MMSTRAFARQSGTWLALAALALQLVLSFAHVHTHRLAALGTDRSDPARIAHARPGLQVAERLAARLGDDDDFCPICFSGFLLSNAALPDAPANARSLQFADIAPAFTAISDRVIAQRRAAFSSRAPPAA